MYDAGGNLLVKKTVAGAKTLFLGETEVTHTPAKGLVPASTTSRRTYTFAGQAVATRTAAGDTGLWFTPPNPQGTATTQINASTAAITKRYFTPFGGPRGAAPAWQSPHGFLGGTGATTDPTTGLTHLGARDYDPALGRFLSVDPLMDTGDPQQLNGYNYANNTPITASDPTGLRPACADEGACTHTQNGNGQGRTTSVKATHTPSIKATHTPVPTPKSKSSVFVSSTTKVSHSHDQWFTAPKPFLRYDRVADRPAVSAPSQDDGPTWSQAGAFAADVSGITEGRECVGGVFNSCLWSAFNVATYFPLALPLKIVKVGKALEKVASTAKSGPEFFRGARTGDAPSFAPRPHEFKVDRETGLVRDTHGVSVFDNSDSVASKGLVPHRLDPGSIPDELQVIQRGQDLHHYEIVPRAGANLTPNQFASCLSQIRCR